MAKKYKEIEEARSAGKEVTGYQGTRWHVLDQETFASQIQVSWSNG